MAKPLQVREMMSDECLSFYYVYVFTLSPALPHPLISAGLLSRLPHDAPGALSSRACFFVFHVQ